MKTLSNAPAIIVSHEPSIWMSCRIITPNLEKAYLKAIGGNLFSLTVEMANDTDRIWKLAGEIHRAQPSKLVFIDHTPHPQLLLQSLHLRYGKKPLPPIYVHLYGDFTLYANQWLNVESIIKKTRIHFLTASYRQENLVSRLLKKKTGTLDHCAFPVDTEFYRFDPTLRRDWRAKLKLRKNQRAIVYTGRLSMQKNVVKVVDCFLRHSSRFDRNSVLLIAGSFDDLSAPFFGIRDRVGSYFQYWNRFLNSQSPESRKRIRFLGHLNSSELLGLYNACDLYFSLSLHHDEDYGMAPAEALCTGLPALLTDWGGYAAFSRLCGRDTSMQKASCISVPVRIGISNLLIDDDLVQLSLARFSMIPYDEKSRQMRSEAFASALSIDAVAEKIRETHSVRLPRFAGFNLRMKKLARRMKTQSLFPEGPRRGTFYEEIYGAYVRDR